MSQADRLAYAIVGSDNYAKRYHCPSQALSWFVYSRQDVWKGNGRQTTPRGISIIFSHPTYHTESPTSMMLSPWMRAVLQWYLILTDQVDKINGRLQPMAQYDPFLHTI